MPPPLIVYEDSGWQRLLPLVYMRPVFQLVCGTGALLSRLQRCADPSLIPWCRPGLADVVAERTGLEVNGRTDGPALLLNGRGLWRSLPEPGEGEAPAEPARQAPRPPDTSGIGSWVGTAGKQNEVACIYADADLMQHLAPSVLLDEVRARAVLAGLPRRDVSEHVSLLKWPWEFVHANEQALVDDWKWAQGTLTSSHGSIHEGVYLLAEESIHIGAGTRIKPCVVIDAEDGPVWIGRDVTILPHSYVQGPASIGDGCLLQPGSVVHAGTTIGPRCKVGGEIEASIIHGFSNKQHDGFLGHSYIGSWVNIAADCINSDLKNTYGTVRVPVNGRSVETGEMFVGMIMGDHSKAGINVSFPTGAVIGFCSSIFAPSSPKFVPSFAWLDRDSAERYDEARGLALAKKVTARRKHIMSPAEERAFLAVRQQALAIEHQPQLQLDRPRRHGA